MGQSSWEASSCSASQEISCLLWNEKGLLLCLFIATTYL
jgi:hypothetical protein